MELFRCFQLLNLSSLVQPSYFLSVISVGWCCIPWGLIQHNPLLLWGEEEGNGWINVSKGCAQPPLWVSGWVGECMDVWVSVDWWVLTSGRYWFPLFSCGGLWWLWWLLGLTRTVTNPNAQVTFSKVKSVIKVVKLSAKLTSGSQIHRVTAADGCMTVWRPNFGWKNEGNHNVSMLGDGKIDVGEWSDAKRVSVRQGPEGPC